MTRKRMCVGAAAVGVAAVAVLVGASLVSGKSSSAPATVRTGKVKIVFRGLEFVGADSDVALRAVYAAGRQNKLWS